MEGANAENLDFSDLMDEDGLDAGIAAHLARTGISDMSEDEYERRAREQEVAKEAAGKLLLITDLFVDRLDDVATLKDLQDFADAYFNVLLPEFLNDYDLDEQTSHLVKMLKGLEREISTFYAKAPILTDEFCLRSGKFKAIKRILEDFTGMLGIVSEEGNWDDMENGVAGMLGISGVGENEMTDLEIALSGTVNKIEIMGILDRIEDSREDVKDATLTSFAHGDESLNRLFAKDKDYQKAMLARAKMIVDSDSDVN